jgi:hypothetical protein
VGRRKEVALLPQLRSEDGFGGITMPNWIIFLLHGVVGGLLVIVILMFVFLGTVLVDLIKDASKGDW